MFKNVLWICLFVISITGCGSGQSNTDSSNNTSTSYLVKPSGTYGIGYQPFYYINSNICPDPYYNESTAASFSPGNTNHCHEFVASVFYPTNIVNNTPTTPYYLPAVLQIQGYLSSLPNVTESEITNAINSAQTYSIPDAVVASGKFPVIIFTPGSGDQAETYQNIISQLVSNGYIVIGIDSVFVSGNILLPDGIITQYPPVNTIPDCDFYNCTPEQLNIIGQFQESQIAIQTSDTYYVINQFESNESNNPILQAMDFSHMGGLGHSLGARLINDLTLSNPGLFKAAAALDVAPIGNNESPSLDTNMPIPFLFGMTASFKNLVYPANTSFEFNQNTYYVGFSPNTQNQEYSEHLNYTDYGTLQYQPLISELLGVLAQSSPGLFLGNGNGYDITNSVNSYLLQFFDTYIKSQPNNVFNTNNCSPLTTNTYIVCGPSSVP